MPCKEWNDDWVAHLYGELEDAEEARLTEHVADCPDCRDTLDELSASRRLLQESVPYVPAPPRVVMLRPRSVWRPGWAFAAGVACALLVFVAGTLTGSLGGQSEPSDSRSGEEDVLTRADLEIALEEQQGRFDERLAAFVEQSTSSGPPTVPASLTQEQFEEALSRLRQEVRYDQARDFRLLLGEISAAEARTANWIDENREVLRFALRNTSRLGEH